MVDEFTRLRPGNHRVHSGWLGLRVCALVVAVLIRVHTWAPWESWGLLGVVGFTGVGPGGRVVHSVLLSSRMCALVVAGLILDSWVNAGAPWDRRGSLGSRRYALRFVRGRWVHSGASRWSSGLFRVVGFTRVRAGGSRVHSVVR